MIAIVKPLFKTGAVYVTCGVKAYMESGYAGEVMDCLNRHLSGDWGDLSHDDKRANDDAVKYNNDRICSAYNLSNGERIYVITEEDHSVTTALLVNEY